MSRHTDSAATPADTSSLRGGPLWRYGGKSLTAARIVPHFARAPLWCEPFFGAGSVFYHLASDAYQRAAVNDLDRSLMTFFRVLRDRADDLVRACELTPYSRDEFIACLERSADDMEEARRVWVRGRQGFAGKARTAGDWGRSDAATWNPGKAEAKLQALRAYASRLRGVAIDSVDAVEFVDKWGHAGAFIYCDPPYVAASRSGEDYEHEMDDEAHRRLAVALHAAISRGARAAVSGYPSALYDETFRGWRRVEVDVPLLGTRDAQGQRRTEVLWMSYPEHEAMGYSRQRSLFDLLAGGAR